MLNTLTLSLWLKTCGNTGKVRRNCKHGSNAEAVHHEGSASLQCIEDKPGSGPVMSTSGQRISKESNMFVTFCNDVYHVSPTRMQHRFAVSSAHCGSMSCKILMYLPSSSTLAWRNGETELFANFALKLFETVRGSCEENKISCLARLKHVDLTRTGIWPGSELPVPD